MTETDPNREPDRETVEAFEKGMGCHRGIKRAWAPEIRPWCTEHPLNDKTALYWTDLGCSVAVAAARVHLALAR